jgi:hypothetical protein
VDFDGAPIRTTFFDTSVYMVDPFKEGSRGLQG